MWGNRFQKVLFLLAVVIFTIIGLIHPKEGYLRDLLLATVILLFFLAFSKRLRMNNVTYTLLAFGLFLHNLGSFGLYATGIFGMQYDHITHFVGLFTAGIICSFIIKEYLSKDKKFRREDFILLFLVFLASLGVGATIEKIEYTGYLIWGQGEGFFAFGSGDYAGLYDEDNLLTIVGGGYFDAMEDLVVNAIGSALAVILFAIWYFKLKENKITKKSKDKAHNGAQEDKNEEDK